MNQDSSKNLSPGNTFDFVSKLALVVVVLFSCIGYAPYGINETDGGFLTGLAYRLELGEIPYRDFIYVRPPVPLYLRWLELKMLPYNYLVLGERYLFYILVGLYSFWGSWLVLRQDAVAALVAIPAFLLGVHNFPPSSWHTVYGLFLATWGLYLWSKYNNSFFAALLLLLAIGCKQSFYPILLFWPAYLILTGSKKALLMTAIVWATAISLVAGLFLQLGALTPFFNLTQGAIGANTAIKAGLFSFFRIHPLVFFLPLPWLLCKWLGWKQWELPAMFFLALGLPVSWSWNIYQHQDFVPPMHQSRLAWWIAVVFVIHFLVGMFRDHRQDQKTGLLTLKAVFQEWKTLDSFHSLLWLIALAWMASISWGYDFPALYPLPGIIVMSWWLIPEAVEGSRKLMRLPAAVVFVILGLSVAGAVHFSQQYIYRDGPRAAMTQHLGEIFPPLTGIYSTADTYKKYQELSQLNARYPDKIAVLPAFPYANFLLQQKPLLPIDWLFDAETNGHNESVYTAIHENKEIYFAIDVEMLPVINEQADYHITRSINQSGPIVEKSSHFLLRAVPTNWPSSHE